jgi:hypothetical protein
MLTYIGLGIIGALLLYAFGSVIFSIAAIGAPRVEFRIKEMGRYYAIEYKTRVFGFYEFWSTLSDAHDLSGEFIHTFPVLLKTREDAETFMEWEKEHGYFPSGYYHRGTWNIISNHKMRRVVKEDEEPKFMFIHPYLNCNMWKLNDELITHTTLTQQRLYDIDNNGRWTCPKVATSENSITA